MTATELLAALVARRVSSVELTQHAIARIERLDGAINAICVRDFERALAAAHAADAARAAGESGALLGLPITVKESFNVAGLPTTWGFPAFRDYVPTEDAVAVARARAAGAIVVGKTNVPVGLGDWQSYNEIYGTTNNPWDLGRTPGGSSGGSAAALAAGFGALSLGSDIAGSLRAPAHFCGIFAHKPSFGLWPSRGHVAPSLPPLVFDRDMSVIGPMARSAADLSLAFDVFAAPDDRSLGTAYQLALRPPRHDELRGFRVLMIDTHPLAATAQSIRTALDRLGDGLIKAGAVVARESPLWPDPTDAARLFARLLMSLLAAFWPAELYEQQRARAASLDAADHSLAAETLRGAVLNHRDWVVADVARARLRQRWRELFAAFDVVVCPIMPTAAFPHDHSTYQETRSLMVDGVRQPYGNQSVWAGVATCPGLPATAFPLGLDHGLPIGAQVIGPMYEDRTPLRFAELVEREFGGFARPPLA
jgi:amidase